MSKIASASLIRQPVHQGTAASLRVAVEPAFDFMSTEYSRLFDSSEATAFQHPIWLQAFFRNLVPELGAQPTIVTGRCSAGRICFVLPLIRRRVNAVALLENADLGLSDYAAPIVDRQWWETINNRDAVMEQIAGHLPAYDVLRLKPVRPEHQSLWYAFLPGKSQSLDFSAHATPVTGPIEAWRERALTASFARMLARKRNRFFRCSGAHLTVLKEPAAIAEAFTCMAQWRVGRFAEDIIQDPAVLAFYRSIALKGAAAGFTRTYALKIGDEAVGYTFAIMSAGRLNYLLIGCNYAEHGRHSPGLLLYDSMIEDWIEQDGNIFDFTIGDEPFKADFGTRPTPMYEISHANSLRGLLAMTAVRLRKRWRARNHDAVSFPIQTAQEVTKNDVAP